MGASGKNWGLGNYLPYKILGINLYTDTEIQNSDTKMEESTYSFERHEDVLSDDAVLDLNILKDNWDDSQQYEVEIDRNDNGDYNNKVTVTLGEYNPKAFIRIVFQDQDAANLAKCIKIRWNVEQSAFEPKLSKFPYVVEVVKGRKQAPYMSTDVFCVSQRQDDQLDEDRDYVYTKIDLVKSNKFSDTRGVTESTVLGLTEKLKTLENEPPQVPMILGLINDKAPMESPNFSGRINFEGCVYTEMAITVADMSAQLLNDFQVINDRLDNLEMDRGTGATMEEEEVAVAERLNATAGEWNGSWDFKYFETTTEGRYLYGLVNRTDESDVKRFIDSEQWDNEYDPSDKKFHDVGSDAPAKWGNDNSGTNISDFPTGANMPIHYWYDSGGTMMIQFHNPYYVA